MKMTRKEFFVMAGPSIAAMCLLMVVPLFVTLYLSFCTYNLGVEPTWVGLRNYRNILTNNGRFWQANWYTILNVLITLPIKTAIGFVMAWLLFKVRNKILKTIFISGVLVPYIITPVVATMMFSWLFKERWGVIWYYLGQIGIHINWFATPLSARTLVILHTIWAGSCFPFLTFYSALQVMPADPLKAAEVEGASSWQKIRYVILPYLSPLIVFVAMMGVMDGYRLYDSVAIMTKGGPGGATTTVQYLAYQMAFGQWNYGQACAISIMMVIVIFLLLTPFLVHMYRESKEI